MTTYRELYSKVLFRLDKTDGRGVLAAQQSVNDACKVIARVRDWDELLELDTTNAATVASTKTYHLVDDWGLTRPKDVLSIRLMDESNSRKLTWLPPRELDKINPYPEGQGEERPTHYTQRGNEVELLPIPGDAYDCYVFYSQWPVALSADDDETVFSDIDDVIISLGTEMANAILENVSGTDWTSRAAALLAGATKEDQDRPDQRYVAQPFQVVKEPTGEWWKKPFTRRDP